MLSVKCSDWIGAETVLDQVFELVGDRSAPSPASCRSCSVMMLGSGLCPRALANSET